MFKVNRILAPECIARSLPLIVATYLILSISNVFDYAGIFIPSQIDLAVSLAGALACMLLVPSSAEAERRQWYHWVIAAALAAGGIIALSFVAFSYDKIMLYSMMGRLDVTGIIIGSILAIVLLEATRRKAGIALPIIILILICIVVFQNYMPGVLYGKGYPIDRLLFSSLVGTNGIFGLPLRVAVETIMVFVMFGTVISASGAGSWFLDLALIMTGRRRGGPAKAAVMASAMVGSISGSPSANAASTGMLTIPMMIRLGYSRSFAAAVEAVASPSGLILPPVMGAIAFVMAEWIGVSYGNIVKAAAIPAILYVLIIYFSVHFQALRDDLQPLPKEDIPDLQKTLKLGWFYPLPLFALCWLLFVEHYPPGMAAALSIPISIAVSFLSHERNNWITPQRLADALIDSVHTWKGIAVITATVGIMVGAMDLSGVGLNMSTFLIDISGGSLLITLVLIGVASLILGMGLDAIPAYITLATLLAPALITLGVSEMGAHLYVIYWGLASFFTPPMCLAVFITSSIAKSDIWETGRDAVMLGLGAFLVPIAFALEPALLLDGTWQEIALSFITALFGTVALAAGLRGYSLVRLSTWRRVTTGVGGILMIYPDAIVSSVGFLLIIVGGVLGTKSNVKRDPRLVS